MKRYRTTLDTIIQGRPIAEDETIDLISDDAAPYLEHGLIVEDGTKPTQPDVKPAPKTPRKAAQSAK